MLSSSALEVVGRLVPGQISKVNSQEQEHIGN